MSGSSDKECDSSVHVTWQTKKEREEEREHAHTQRKRRRRGGMTQHVLGSDGKPLDDPSHKGSGKRSRESWHSAG